MFAYLEGNIAASGVSSFFSFVALVDDVPDELVEAFGVSSSELRPLCVPLPLSALLDS